MISASVANISSCGVFLNEVSEALVPSSGKDEVPKSCFFWEQTKLWNCCAGRFLTFTSHAFAAICKASLLAEACSFVAEHRFYLRKVVERVEMVTCSLMIPCCKPVENTLKDHENLQCVKVSYFRRCLKQCLQLLFAFGEGSGSWGLLQSHSSFSFSCQRAA